MEASLSTTTLLLGSRITTVPLKKELWQNSNNKQRPLALTLQIVNCLFQGDIERVARGGGPGAPATTPTPATPQAYSGLGGSPRKQERWLRSIFFGYKMYFTINQEGKSYEVVSKETLPAKFSFKAGLQKNGTMRLFIDNKEIGSAKAAGVFKNDLEVPLRVGADPRSGTDKIADYPDSTFVLRGTNLPMRNWKHWKALHLLL
jgi:hypothetical protein